MGAVALKTTGNLALVLATATAAQDLASMYRALSPEVN
jgi:hypothetical protein